MTTTRQSAGFSRSTEQRAEDIVSPERPYCIAAYSLAAQAFYVVRRHDAEGAHPMVYEHRENAQRRLAEVAKDVPTACVYSLGARLSNHA